jgi:protocatechuate 3,4-dioxygenase beta subunit
MKCFLLAGFVSACTLAAQSNPGAASLEGHVLNALTGAPLRKATVVLTAPTSPIRLIADTDAEGRFQFIGLPPGTYKLSASRTGFLDRPARRPIPLGPNDQVRDAEIRLPPQSVIAGHVLDERGEPVDRARVAIFKQVYRDGRKQWDRINAVPETNDTGEYRFPNLRPGRYLLQAFNLRPEIDNQYGNPPKMFYVPAYYPNAPSQLQASPVDVGTGAEVRGIDIHLFKVARPPDVHVRGRVTGVPADSQILVSVSLLPVDGGPFGGGSTVASPPDYAFDLSTPPGQYTVFGNVYSSADPAAYGTRSLTVTGDVAGVVLAMSPAPTVTGRISLAERGGKVNLQGVRVALTRLSSSLVSEVWSDAAGKFVFPKPVSPGHYAIVNLRSIPDGCFVREVKLDGQEISWDDFEISASTQMEIVLSNTAGRIAGSALDADGKPFTGASVTLIPADGKSRPVRQSVGDDGSFRFTGVRPGKYKLFAWEEVDDDLWQDPEFRKEYENRATEITVGPGETHNAQLRVIAVDAMR